MIRAGERVPNVEVMLAPAEPVRVRDLAPPGAAFLLLFYLFDWSRT
ncbi:MAG: hypothetical protein M3312_02605 [Actinomycetota bacterium]|nr:hypothetical protein [Actinomycetota bacterium]